MSESVFSDRLAGVREEITASQRRGGWTCPVRIIAVTKTHQPAAVVMAAGAGLEDVGENRVQEALIKQDALGDRCNVKWHMIGPVQRRKVRQLIGRFALIESLDRIELAQELQRRMEPATVQSVLVQVNCSGEPQKHGVGPNELMAMLASLREFDGVEVQGLMTMAAYGADEATLHRTFGKLRELRDVAVADGHQMTELSMGMSDDYPIAVEEGATMVRLGTALFGPREST